MQARVAHPVRSLVHQLLGHHPAEGDAEHVDALVSEDIEHPLDGPGDPGNAAWPGVGRGLPHTGRVEADRLHSARTEFPFEGCGEVEARADAWGGPYKGPSYIKGEDWIPYRPPNEVSPPFAEYGSGHSTFSMAAAEVLTSFTGRGNFELKVTIPAGSSKVEPRTATQPGVPAKPITLSWTNFQYAAEQAGLSRQYGGVHFEHGDKDARACGAKVGDNAWAKALTYFNGTAT